MKKPEDIKTDAGIIRRIHSYLCFERLVNIIWRIFLAVFIAVLVILATAALVHAENYSIAQIRAAAFFNGCTKDYCAEPDGQFPIYISAGHRWVDVLGNVDIDVSYMHRSNLDIGWPRKGETGKTEYNRDGFAIGVTYKFNRR